MQTDPQTADVEAQRKKGTGWSAHGEMMCIITGSSLLATGGSLLVCCVCLGNIPCPCEMRYESMHQGEYPYPEPVPQASHGIGGKMANFWPIKKKKGNGW